jgi:hypothetical protein
VLYSPDRVVSSERGEVVVMALALALDQQPATNNKAVVESREQRAESREQGVANCQLPNCQEPREKRASSQQSSKHQHQALSSSSSSGSSAETETDWQLAAGRKQTADRRMSTDDRRQTTDERQKL